jgi:protein-S-isoprenylcysteine O-methyltransferase Ste14
MEFGLWNAWWFFLYYWLPMPLLRTFRPANLDSMSGGEVTPAEARQRTILYILFFAAVAYSLFVPFRLGTLWFYVGLPIALVGALFYGFAVRELMREELDKNPLQHGAYRFSRHPLYVAEAIMFIGVAIACTSVWILLFAGITFGFHAAHVAEEERACTERYGERYEAYLRRTPRWLGVPHRTD